MWRCSSSPLFVVTDWMDSLDLPKDEVEQHIRMLRRIVLSALPVVADAADVNRAELDADYLRRFADQEFPPVTMDTAPPAIPKPT